ncbi:MAG: radical SAM protein [Gaiellales bacterium]|nr:MAG: radical SAM protein [Gaiellales bacterium]
MCNIWQSGDSSDLDPALVEKLPASLKYVNLSGGEPFLHKRLEDIVRAVRTSCPSAQTIISTNALLGTARMLERMEEIRSIDPGIGVAVSLDGIGPVHDRIRGIEGAYDKCLAFIRGLQQAGMTNLRLAFTVVDDNVDDFYRVYQLSRELGIEFTCALAQESTHYFQTTGVGRVDLERLRRQVDMIAASELRSLEPKRWARAYFSRGLYEFAAGDGRPLTCRAADDFFFMSPDGSIYTCNILDLPLGNLREDSFEAVWDSTAAAEARRKVASCEIGCWMVCTARSAIKRNPARVAAWVASGKVRALLGREVMK